MANYTIYPFGLSSQTPAGLIAAEIAAIQAQIDRLANIAFRDLNPAFKDVSFFPITSDGNNAGCALRLGCGSTQTSWMSSPIIDLGEEGDSRSLTFSCGEVRGTGNNYPAIIFFNNNGEYHSFYVANSDPRNITVNVDADHKYARIIFKTSLLDDAYMMDADTGEYLFKGEDLLLQDILSFDDYYNSEYMLDSDKANSRGDFIGWNYALSDTEGTAQKNGYGAAMYKQTGDNADGYSFSIGKLVELPQTSGNISIQFSCGEAISTGGICLVLSNETTKTGSYYLASSNPRTVTVNTANYTHARLYFRTANYASCFIKDATNNEMLWEGAASTD